MTALSKEEYLKKYLNPVESGDYKKRKRKKGEKIISGRGMKIVDDDVSWSNIAPTDEDDALLDNEEKPQIAVIDNRTKKEKEMDEYRKSAKWKTFKDEDEKSGSDNVIKIGDSDSDIDDVPRNRKRHDSSSDTEVRRKVTRHDSDSDQNVPRSNRRHDSNSDIEPPRQKSTKQSHKSNRHDSDSDVKRARQNHKKSSNKSRKRHDSSDSDLDVSRSRSRSSKSQRSRHDSDSDLEIPRSGVNNGKYSNSKHLGKNHEKHKKINKSRRDSSSDSDLNIPRTKNASKHNNREKSTKEASDSDIEVPRPRKSRNDSDSDMEIPRRRKNKNTEALKAKLVKGQMTSGGTGGLTSRHELKKELLEKKKHDSGIDKLARETKKNETVYREKGGKKRDLEKEREIQAEENKVKQKKLDKYNKWGKGLIQDEMKNYAVEDLVHESNKPLARYRDDADLDALQRSQVRDGDPMAEYLAKKKHKESGNAPSLPKYRGPAPPPNRYQIQPGYRWDGVDRSNGFEKKYYMNISDRKADKQDAYKWSVEDM